MNNPETEFSNSVLHVAELPDYSAAELQPVAPTFRRYLWVTTGLYWIIPLIVSGVTDWIRFVNIGRPWLSFVLLLMVVGLVLLYRLADARHRGWALREHDLIAQSGVWWRSTTTLPIARIQHVESSSGPIERMHGLARLKCYTAGGMTADLVLIALSEVAANGLREHLLEQIRERDADTRGANADARATSLLEGSSESSEAHELDFLEDLEPEVEPDSTASTVSPDRDLFDRDFLDHDFLDRDPK
ncbi:MAG: PH domain-containing protein [Pseudomonadota bacterium]